MNLEEQQRRLRERDAAWSKLASSGGDVEEILDFWTDDAVVVPPGMPPVRGKDALRDYVTGSQAIPGFSISWSADQVELSADGSLAWMLGSNLVEMDGEDGAIRSEGRVVTVWRLEDDGEWRCCLDLWNEAPAAMPAG